MENSEIVEPAFFGDVLEIVLDSWGREKTALPLARLGQLLRVRGYVLSEQLKGKKLADFISSNFQGRLKIISHPSKALTLGVLPFDVKVEGDVESYFRKKNPSDGLSVSAKQPRFHRGVWLAFTQELEQGFVRTLFLEPRPHFKDVSESAEDVYGKLKIGLNDIISNEASISSAGSAEAIVRAIVDWAARNEVPMDRLCHNGSHKSESIFDARRLHGSLLERIVNALSEEELKEVKIPLNVVKKLMRH